MSPNTATWIHPFMIRDLKRICFDWRIEISNLESMCIVAGAVQYSTVEHKRDDSPTRRILVLCTLLYSSIFSMQHTYYSVGRN